jgi:hypothetical protein
MGGELMFVPDFCKRADLLQNLDYVPPGDCCALNDFVDTLDVPCAKEIEDSTLPVAVECDFSEVTERPLWPADAFGANRDFIAHRDQQLAVALLLIGGKNNNAGENIGEAVCFLGKIPGDVGRAVVDFVKYIKSETFDVIEKCLVVQKKFRE